VLEQRVRLVFLDDPRRRAVNPRFARDGDVVSFADAYPMLLASEDSLNRLNDWIADGPRPEEGPLAITRFRPNLIVSGALPFAEDGWARIRIGDATFRVVKGCDRCVLTTLDPETGEKHRVGVGERDDVPVPREPRVHGTTSRVVEEDEPHPLLEHVAQPGVRVRAAPARGDHVIPDADLARRAGGFRDEQRVDAGAAQPHAARDQFGDDPQHPVHLARGDHLRGLVDDHPAPVAGEAPRLEERLAEVFAAARFDRVAAQSGEGDRHPFTLRDESICPVHRGTARQVCLACDAQKSGSDTRSFHPSKAGRSSPIRGTNWAK
jgi:hypothetical protein